MPWYATDDLDEFLANADGFLRARPVEHTVQLTVTETLVQRGSQAFSDAVPRFGWWRADDGSVAGAYLQTPPYPLLLTGVPDVAVPSLVPLLAGTDQVNAPVPVLEALRRNGIVLEPEMKVRLFQLGGLTPPDPMPAGRVRVAQEPDRALMCQWYREFLDELGELDADVAAAIDDRLSYDGIRVWEVDGVPVSMAAHTRPIAGMVRIGPVYTPPSARRHGYAAAVTAAISAQARRMADHVLLFTDLANPTSNGIYRRLGYEPLQDRWKCRVVRSGHGV
jgi:GNAT superfamily N-acetyltransferase